MILYTIPILKRDDVNGEIVDTIETLNVRIDPSIYAELRWEQNFPKLAENVGLFDYIKNIVTTKDGANNSISVILSLLKAAYCLLDEEYAWEDFAKFFVLGNLEYMKKLIISIKGLLKIVLNGSAEKN